MAVRTKDAVVGVRPAPARARGFAPRRALGRDWAAAWLFLAPCMLVLIGLIAYPFVSAIVLSFQAKLVGSPATWVGLDNYVQLLTGPTRDRIIGRKGLHLGRRADERDRLREAEVVRQPLLDALRQLRRRLPRPLEDHVSARAERRHVLESERRERRAQVVLRDPGAADVDAA